MPIRIVDPVYGPFEIGEFERKLILTPEVQRLRDIRQSNINSVFLPGVANVSRYEHSIGVGYLARIVSDHLMLDDREKMQLVAAGILHDVATPPFGHTIEYILKEQIGFDHEKMASEIITGDFIYPIFQGLFTRSSQILMEYSLSPSEVASYVKGEGEFGKLINAEMDLDNIDNVVRTAIHTSKNIPRYDPIKLTEGFIVKGGILFYSFTHLGEAKKWFNSRLSMYHEFFRDPYDWSAKTTLAYLFEECVLHDVFHAGSWTMTDGELLSLLSDRKRLVALGCPTKIAEKMATIARKFMVGDLFQTIGWFKVDRKENIAKLNNLKERKAIEKELRSALKLDVILDFVPNNKYKPLRLNVLKRLIDKEEISEVTLGERDTMWLLCVTSPHGRLSDIGKKRIREKCAETFEKILDEKLLYVPYPQVKL